MSNLYRVLPRNEFETFLGNAYIDLKHFIKEWFHNMVETKSRRKLITQIKDKFYQIYPDYRDIEYKYFKDFLKDYSINELKKIISDVDSKELVAVNNKTC